MAQELFIVTVTRVPDDLEGREEGPRETKQSIVASACKVLPLLPPPGESCRLEGLFEGTPWACVLLLPEEA